MKLLYNSQIIPSIVGEPSSITLNDLRQQIASLLSSFEKISIRIPVRHSDNFTQLPALLELLGLSNVTDKLYILFDFEYIKAWPDISAAVLSINNLINEQGWQSVNIPLFSSCPANFPIGRRENGYMEQMPIAEYEALRNIATLPRSKLSYGDYGYVHPRRNESAGFWLPRIDYPAADGFCYYTRAFNRQASRIDNKLTIKTLFPNDAAYRSLSASILGKPFFLNDTLACWGRDKILENTMADKITGKSPQHYISIRSNIHMERVMNLLDGYAVFE